MPMSIDEILAQIKEKDQAASPEDEFNNKLAAAEDKEEEILLPETEETEPETEETEPETEETEPETETEEAEADKIAEVQRYDAYGRIMARAMIDEFNKVANLTDEEYLEETNEKIAEDDPQVRILTTLYNELYGG